MPSAKRAKTSASSGPRMQRAVSRAVARGYSGANALKARYGGNSTRAAIGNKYGIAERMYNVTLNAYDEGYAFPGSFEALLPPPNVLRRMSEQDIFDALYAQFMHYLHNENTDDSTIWATASIPGAGRGATMEFTILDLDRPVAGPMDNYVQDMPLTGEQLAGFEDLLTEDVRVTKGRCLISCVSIATQKARYEKYRLSEEQVIESMESQGIETVNGVSVRELMHWRNACMPKMSISVYDITRNRVLFDKAPGSREDTFNLSIVAFDGHAYPITGTYGKTLADNRVRFEIEPETRVHVVGEISENYDTAEVIVHTQDRLLFDKLFDDAVVASNRLDIVMEPEYRSAAGCKSFIDPATGQMHIYDADYDQRRQLAAVLARKYPDIETFKFKGQTYAQLFAAYLNHSAVHIPESSYNAELEDMVDRYQPRPLAGFCEHEPVPAGMKQYVFDIAKCYPSVIMSEFPGLEIALYSPMSYTEPYSNEPLIDWHEYYCSFVIPGFPHYTKAIFRGDTIRDMRSLGCTVNVIWHLVPFCAVDGTVVSDVFDSMKQLPANVFKRFANTATGYFGRRIGMRNQMFVLRDVESACEAAAYLKQETDYRTVKITKTSCSYIVSAHEKFRRQKDTHSIYRTIIQRGMIRTLRLAAAVQQVGGIVRGYKTDCVHFSSARYPAEILDSTKYGGIRDDTADAGELLEMTYSYEIPKDLDKKYKQGQGIWVNAIAGAGKSWQAKKIIREAIEDGASYMILAITHCALNNFRFDEQLLKLDPEIKSRCKTFAAFKSEAESKGTDMAKLLRNKNVIVDETSFLDRESTDQLILAISKYGCNVIAFGDNRQCAPVESAESYVFFNGEEFHPTLCTYFDCQEKEYREDSGRYDDPAFAYALTELARTGVVPQYIRERVRYQERTFLPDRPCISYRRCKSAWKVNEARSKQRGGNFVKQRRFDSNGKGHDLKNRFCIGTPCIASGNISVKGYRLIPTNEYLEIVSLEFDNGHVSAYVVETETGEHVSLPAAKFEHNVDPRFCTTVHSVQGKTFDFDYGILDAEFEGTYAGRTYGCSREVIYTALSRARRAEQITIYGAFREFYPPENEGRSAFVPDTYNKYASTKIYRIRDSASERRYIGYTCCSLPKRLERHLEAGKKSAICDYTDPKIELVCRYPCASKADALKRETFYIHKELVSLGADYELLSNKQKVHVPDLTERTQKALVLSEPVSLMPSQLDPGFWVQEPESGKFGYVMYKDPNKGGHPRKKRFILGDDKSKRSAYDVLRRRYCM